MQYRLFEPITISRVQTVDWDLTKGHCCWCNER